VKTMNKVSCNQWRSLLVTAI